MELSILTFLLQFLTARAQSQENEKAEKQVNFTLLSHIKMEFATTLKVVPQITGIKHLYCNILNIKTTLKSKFLTCIELAH